jgi:hypothetical protein
MFKARRITQRICRPGGGWESCKPIDLNWSRGHSHGHCSGRKQPQQPTTFPGRGLRRDAVFQPPARLDEFNLHNPIGFFA